ncbi:gamma-glutamylcyclotransferase [Spirosoma sp. KUDC1026]|uniref:gamma-glutamylcyclotransferase family protein n=1 Tax=Spirosoma sp. KUDC1026 TaxID=2745947 RepID=UPI00159BD3B6|nr:gamma-glutamylcyclotransferase family protein [Spirosoma sp. KUDC1026]QKZ11693.1 gamma-glutamylcyclotransferase [Spirosoma sp. KUDC1026]
MATDSDFLFVYGTLGPSFTNPHATLLHQNSQYVGPGTLAGLLADLGNYPGVIHDSSAITVVHGFIYNIGTRKTELLKTLDEYEGIGPDFPEPQEYVRTIVPISNDGTLIPCWTYLYNLSIHTQLLINSGDYALFLSDQQQKSRLR